MSGKITSFISSAFHMLFTQNPPTRVYSAENLANAKAYLDKSVCPECVELSSFRALEVKDNGDSDQMCCNCGAKWTYSVQGELIGFGGFDATIYDIHRYRREAENQRIAAHAMEREARRRAA